LFNCIFNAVNGLGFETRDFDCKCHNLPWLC